MNNYEKALLAIAFVLFAAAIAISLPEAKPQKNETALMEAEGKGIIYNAIGFGIDRADYAYRFSENINGYEKEYFLVKNNDTSYIEINDQVGLQRIYLKGNQSFLCVDYKNTSKCAETTSINDSTLKNYYEYLRSLFFSKEKADRESGLFDEFFPKGVVSIKKVGWEEIEGKKCRMVEYSIDYTNLSVADATRYGIPLSMPRHFEWQICQADNMPVYKHMVYSYNGVEYDTRISIKEFSSPIEIIMPAELDESAYELFYDEIAAQQSLSGCFSKPVSEREKCVSLAAFTLYKPSLCKSAGSQADTCIIRLMPYLKDENWCAQITGLDYKDDCYTELAGALKNSSYCERIANASKVDFCLNVSAVVLPPVNATEGSANETGKSNESAG